VTVRAVLLDMGGVLIPEVSSYEGARLDGASDAWVRECGRRVSAAYRARREDCLDRVLADVEPGLRRALLRAFRAEADQPPYSFARPVVAALARTYRLGLVSNTVLPGAHHARTLARAGILEHLGAAVWSADFGRRKPDPAMLLFVLDRLGVPARDAVFVGDKLRTDVVAARRAGVRSVWLRAYGAAATPEAPRPDFIITDLRQLPGLLKRL
jgi:HAD superfamily hydrolase (TIGR01509 family)